MKRFIHTHRRFGLLTAGLIVASLAVAFAPNVLAQTETGGGSSLLGRIGSGILDVTAGTLFSLLVPIVAAFIKLLGGLLGIAISLLQQVTQYNDFINALAVEKGWVVVRDITNIMFVVVVIVMSFGTVVRWEAYHYRKLLPRSILMVFLVNFSKTIAGFFIDFCQVAMVTFVNGFKDAAASSIITSTGVRQMLSLGNEIERANDILPSIFLAYALAATLLTILVIVIFVYVLMFLGRIIVLWILLVLSPMPYVLSVFPGGSKYNGQWWSTFWKYATMGPILAFFLWLSLIVMAANPITDSSSGLSVEIRSGVPTTGTPAEPTDFDISATISRIGSSNNILSYIIAISMLVIALGFANSMGGVAGKAAGRLAGNVGKFAAVATGLAAGAFAGRKLGGVVGRKVQERAPFLFPSFWKEGFFKRGERLREETRTIAAGRGEQFSEKVFKSWIGARTPKVLGGGRAGAEIPRAEIAKRQVIEKKMGERHKEIGTGMDAKELLENLGIRAYNTGGHEGEQERQTMIELATARGNFDDLLKSFVTKNVIKDDRTARDMGFADRASALERLSQYDDRSVRQFAMGYMGLDRNRYDPEKILENQLGGDSRLFKLYTGEIDIKQASDAEKEQLKDHAAVAQEQAKTAAIGSDTLTQDKLRSLFAVGQVGRRVGHWEQTTTKLDSGTGKYYVMGFDELIGEVAGEGHKAPQRQFLQSLAPHNWQAQAHDTDTNEYGWSTDPTKRTRYQRAFANQVLTPGIEYELHQAQERVAAATVGTVTAVGPKEALFDKDGNYNPQNPDAERRWKEILENDTIAAASWNKIFRKNHRSTAKVPGQEGFVPDQAPGAPPELSFLQSNDIHGNPGLQSTLDDLRRSIDSFRTAGGDFSSVARTMRQAAGDLERSLIGAGRTQGQEPLSQKLIQDHLSTEVKTDIRNATGGRLTDPEAQRRLLAKMEEILNKFKKPEEKKEEKK